MKLNKLFIVIVLAFIFQIMFVTNSYAIKYSELVQKTEDVTGWYCINMGKHMHEWSSNGSFNWEARYTMSTDNGDGVNAYLLYKAYHNEYGQHKGGVYELDDVWYCREWWFENKKNFEFIRNSTGEVLTANSNWMIIQGYLWKTHPSYNGEESSFDEWKTNNNVPVNHVNVQEAYSDAYNWAANNDDNYASYAPPSDNKLLAELNKEQFEQEEYLYFNINAEYNDSMEVYLNENKMSVEYVAGQVWILDGNNYSYRIKIPEGYTGDYKFKVHMQYKKYTVSYDVYKSTDESIQSVAKITADQEEINNYYSEEITITVIGEANVDITNHIAFIGTNSDAITFGQNKGSNSEAIFNTNNEKGYRWCGSGLKFSSTDSKDGKDYNAIAYAGQYVVFKVEITNNEKYDTTVDISKTFSGNLSSGEDAHMWLYDESGNLSEYDTGTGYPSSIYVKANQQRVLYMKVQAINNSDNTNNSVTLNFSLGQCYIKGYSVDNKASRKSESDTFVVPYFNVSVTKHIANISSNGDWLNGDSGKNSTYGYYDSQLIENEEGASYRHLYKSSKAVAEVGDYIYYLILVRNDSSVSVNVGLEDTMADFAYQGDVENIYYYSSIGKTVYNREGELGDDGDGYDDFSFNQATRKINFKTGSIAAGEEKRIYIKIHATESNCDTEKIYDECKNTVSITNLRYRYQDSWGVPRTFNADNVDVKGYNKSTQTSDSDIFKCRKADVTITKHIAKITDNSIDYAPLDESPNEDGFVEIDAKGREVAAPDSVDVWNTTNAYSIRSTAKTGTAVADVGDYVYFVVEIHNKNGYSKSITVEDVFENYTGEVKYRKYKYSSTEDKYVWGPTHTENYGTGNKITITSDIGARKYEKIYFRVQLTKDNLNNIDSNLYEENTNTATITAISNLIGDESYSVEIKNTDNDSDKVKCRKYDVNIDLGITNVIHKENHENTSDHKGFFTDLDSRTGHKTSTIKKADPAYIELGDKVEYTLTITNNVQHTNVPQQGVLYSKDYDKNLPIYPKISITLPENISSRNLKKENHYGIKDATLNGKKINTGEFSWSELENILDGAQLNGNVLTINFYTPTDYTFGIYQDKSLVLVFDFETTQDDEKYELSKDLLAETKAEITQIRNKNECLVENVAASVLRSNEKTETFTQSSDFWGVKEYNISVDSYIIDVSHSESRGGANKTYNGTTRRYEAEGKNLKRDENPVINEYGDTLTFRVHLYNTQNKEPYNLSEYFSEDELLDKDEDPIDPRDLRPYKQPENVTVDLTIDLPANYSDVYTSAGTSHEVDEENNKLYIKGIKIGTNGVSVLQFSYKVENVSETNIFETKASIDNNSITNVNGLVIQNNSKNIISSDYYKLNDYDVSIDEYISAYNHEMMDYNNNNGFTSGETSDLVDRSNNTVENKNTHPLPVEKYETLTYSTVIKNNATGEAENKEDSYGKYATRARPTDVTIDVPYGLDNTSIQMKWHKSDGTETTLSSSDVSVSTLDDNKNKKHTYVYHITNENVILSPNDYILYTMTFKVSESNMCLDRLEKKATITTLTNVNRNEDNTRIVANSSYNRNISTRQTDSDYIRLKDLVISGTVWIDNDKNGYNNDEPAKEGITVKLYNEDGYVQTRTTDENGFYTFGRHWKAAQDENGNYTSSTYRKYYVEFEYDGIFYKATEVYGGDSDGDADGTGNLPHKCKTCGELPNEYWSKSAFQAFIKKFPGWEVCSNCTTGFDGGHTVHYDGEKSRNCPVCKGTIVWRCSDCTNGKADNLNNSLGDWRWLIGESEGMGEQKYMTDSNAYEFDDVRNTFNSDHQAIGYNKAYTKSGDNFDTASDLSYSKSGHISTLNEDPAEDRIMTARSFIKQDYNNTVNKSLDNTNTLFLYEYSGHSNNYPETEYLKYINLGLVRREEVDLSIEEDAYFVKTTINGEEMRYDLNENTADSTKSDYNSQPTAYKKIDDNAYNLSLYTADFNYRNDKYYEGNQEIIDYKGNESELNVEVAYRIRITNNSITNDEPNLGNKDVPIEVALNEMAIYYDTSFLGDVNTTKKIKDEETGLLKDYTYPAIDVYYGTKTDLDKGKGKQINSCKSSSSRFSTNKMNESQVNAMKEAGYNVLYLTGADLDNEYIKEGESRYIEIKFTVNKVTKDGIARTLNLFNGSESLEIGVISEIGAYTTRYGSSYSNKGLAGKYAGLIDRDSNPSNVNYSGIESYDNYEDDTYKVGMYFHLLDGVRTINGIVWDDARSTESSTQYIGNGEYNTSDTNADGAKTNPNDTGENNDKPISGVKVSLWEIVQRKDGGYYEFQAKDSNNNDIYAISNANGEYVLKDYIPGYYKVRFDYGYDVNRADNILYNGQDYKSTTYYNDGYYTSDKGYSTDNIASAKNYTYFDNVKTALNVPKKSDAQDDEIRRLEVNSYSETMTVSQSIVFSEPESHKNSLINNTNMYADSTIFYVKPEKVNSAVTNINAMESGFNSSRLWNLSSLDFGLQYRPEASIVLNKNISSMELVTSNGETLVRLNFKDGESGNRIIDPETSIGNDNVQFIPNNGKNKQGVVYVNMDTDILEGCSIKVDYEMNATNESEIDYINKNLDAIKYIDDTGSYSNFRTTIRLGTTEDYAYNANATAATLLSKMYNDSYNGNAYLKLIKKPYTNSGTTSYDGVTLSGKEYYGMYLGEMYYTGKKGNRDIVAELKVDHILDYIDNDFTFVQSDNSTKDRTWQTTTSKELKDNNMLNFEKVLVDNEENMNLVDKYGIRYDTDMRSNLALSTDSDRRKLTTGNVSLSSFLTTTKNATSKTTTVAKINAVASKILSATDITEGDGLKYENISEIIQYTTLTGRRTTLPDEKGKGGIIGNANVFNWNGYESPEDDTDATEVITISPPTGLK